jgi:hypothetical protein
VQEQMMGRSDVIHIHENNIWIVVDLVYDVQLEQIQTSHFSAKSLFNRRNILDKKGSNRIML